MTELLPCPFCGGEAEYGITFAGEEVYCKKCHAAMPRVTTEAEAIKTWNTRAERTCKLDRNDVCNVCGACIQRITHSVYEMGDSFACYPNYCPNCGAKVVSE